MMIDNNKLPLRTLDLSNKNYAALATLFPNTIIETIGENGEVVSAIDADVLAQEINTHVVSGKDTTLVNVAQIFKAYSPMTERKVL